VIGQERFNAAVGHQLAAQRRRVQQLAVRVSLALHPASLNSPPPDREHRRPISSTLS
jgi:hypothetical protein